MLAAERSKNAAFAISVSAPLSTPEVQMQFATMNLLTVRGGNRFFRIAGTKLRINPACQRC
jgi:hypothetical protein